MGKKHYNKGLFALLTLVLVLSFSLVAFATEEGADAKGIVADSIEAVEEKADEAAAALSKGVEEAKEKAEAVGAEIEEAASALVAEAKELTAVDTTGMSRLEAAIALAPKGAGEGKIDESQPRGFLGIPGGPQVNLILAFFWAIWVGWIFSTVGAFGGVMAGVGHMSVFGLGAYANTFKATPAMNTTITDSVRVSNQMLVGFSSLVSTLRYVSMGRVVLPLGIALGCGSLLGSFLIPWLTQGKVSFSDYMGYFGLFVLALGVYLLYETTPAGMARREKGTKAAKAFEEASQKEGAPTGVQVTSVSLKRVEFTFCGVEFGFSTFLPMVGGFVIASVAAFLGVGGGFLLVPFLTSISQLPMYLAAGTSAFAVLIGMVTSITTFMFGGTPVYWSMVGVELVGILIGSYIGPMTSRYISDKWLKRIFVVLAVIVGFNYVLRGFFGIRLF